MKSIQSDTPGLNNLFFFLIGKKSEFQNQSFGIFLSQIQIITTQFVNQGEMYI